MENGDGMSLGDILQIALNARRDDLFNKKYKVNVKKNLVEVYDKMIADSDALDETLNIVRYIHSEFNLSTKVYLIKILRAFFKEKFGDKASLAETKLFVEMRFNGIHHSMKPFVSRISVNEEMTGYSILEKIFDENPELAAAVSSLITYGKFAAIVAMVAVYTQETFGVEVDQDTLRGYLEISFNPC